MKSSFDGLADRECKRALEDKQQYERGGGIEVPVHKQAGDEQDRKHCGDWRNPALMQLARQLRPVQQLVRINSDSGTRTENGEVFAKVDLRAEFGDGGLPFADFRDVRWSE